MKYIDVVVLSDFNCLVSVKLKAKKKKNYADIVVLFYIPQNSFLRWILVYVVVFTYTFTKT